MKKQEAGTELILTLRVMSVNVLSILNISKIPSALSWPDLRYTLSLYRVAFHGGSKVRVHASSEIFHESCRALGHDKWDLVPSGSGLRGSCLNPVPRLRNKNATRISDVV